LEIALRAARDGANVALIAKSAEPDPRLPRTLIATAALQNLLGGDEAMAVSRKPALYADAAHAVITRPSRGCTGNTVLCGPVR
jgi:hypothetical protein